MAAPLAHMDDLQQVEFAEALVHLQGLIGKRVKATLNLYGRFFGCGVEGRLDRVETLPPDHSAISIVLDERQGFFLDPAEVETFVGRGREDGGQWLEFRLGSGASVVLEHSLREAT
jgi:hypothetical protein